MIATGTIILPVDAIKPTMSLFGLGCGTLYAQCRPPLRQQLTFAYPLTPLGFSSKCIQFQPSPTSIDCVEAICRRCPPNTACTHGRRVFFNFRACLRSFQRTLRRVLLTHTQPGVHFVHHGALPGPCKPNHRKHGLLLPRIQRGIVQAILLVDADF